MASSRTILYVGRAQSLSKLRSRTRPSATLSKKSLTSFNAYRVTRNRIARNTRLGMMPRNPSPMLRRGSITMVARRLAVPRVQGNSPRTYRRYTNTMATTAKPQAKLTMPESPRQSCSALTTCNDWMETSRTRSRYRRSMSACSQPNTRRQMNAPASNASVAPAAKRVCLHRTAACLAWRYDAIADVILRRRASANRPRSTPSSAASSSNTGMRRCPFARIQVAFG